MNTTMTDAGPFEKLLTFQVAETEIDKAKSAAARKLAKDVKIPGFRPGKAPRPVLEAAIGEERLRSEAIEELLPEVVTLAVREMDLEPAVVPAVQGIKDVDTGVEVEVKITTWPTLSEIPIYRDRRVVITAIEVTDEELEENIDRMRDQFAELETIEREARDGDYVTVNLSATAGGTNVEEAAANDLLYEVGSGSFVEGIDPHLQGAKAGAIVSFDGPLPAGFGDRAGEAVTYQVLVKEVKEKKLPDLTDEWASDNTEFETVSEVRDSLRERILAMKQGNAANEYSAKLTEDLLDDMDLEIPEAIVDAEMENIFHSFSHRLEAQGISIGDYLQISGQDQDSFVADLRDQASRNVANNVLLDAVARQEELEVDDDDYSELMAALATQAQQDADELKDRLAGTSQEKELRGDILRRKALDALLSAAVPVDSEDRPVDLEVGQDNHEVDGEDEPAEEPDEK